jgi:hypothetical protein
MTSRTNAMGAATGRGHIDLRVTVIGIAPAPAFEQAMRCRDPTQRDAAGQMAAPVNDAAAELADIQGLTARMFTAC